MFIEWLRGGRVLLVWLCFASVALPIESAGAAEGISRTYFQAYLGAAGFAEESMTFAEVSDSDPETISTTDLSSLPYLGLSAQFALAPGKTHVGIDSSLLFGWRSDDSSVAAGNGQLKVEIDSKLWLLDVAMGLYAQTFLGERWRLYGALGPMLLFADYSDDSTEADQTASPPVDKKESYSDSEFGVGGYAKLGLEYALSSDAYIGVAVRGITTNLEFERAIDDDGLQGLQGFVTFTRAY